MAVAMYNYSSANGSLPPPAVYDKQGRPLLSWRVLILSYIEQDDLFKQFRLDQPWDSPHNLNLLPKMPRTYAPFDGRPTPEPYSTYYQVFVGKGAAFEGPRGTRLEEDFPDGTSNTFLIVEAGEAVPWTKPVDLPYDAKKPLPRLGGVFKKSFQAALADGSVRGVSRDTSKETIRAAITRNGGDELGPDW
jgi:hypothetical protein